MKITVDRTISVDAIAEIYPYTARIEIIDATKDRGAVYEIPVRVHHNGLQKSFSVELCGFMERAKHPQQLIPLIDHRLRELIKAMRFPTYVFIARRAQAIFPVYTINNEVLALTTIGPVFKHVELAKVREYLTDFLHSAKILGDEGLSDKLHVRGVSAYTLGLRRPVFYLKKRIVGQTDFWAPVFQSRDGQLIYAYAASARREVRRQDDEVLALHDLVAERLMQDGRLRNAHDLRPDRLLPAYWRRLQQLLTQETETAVADQPVTFYTYKNLWLGVEPRPDEERYGLFLGDSKADLIHRIEQDFERRNV